MSQFIKLTSKFSGKAEYINFERVFSFNPVEEGTRIYESTTADEYITVVETPEKILELLSEVIND